MPVTRVWIADGCIYCVRCVSSAPRVFDMGGDSAVVLAAVRTDGVTDANHAEGADLRPRAGAELSGDIIAAAEECPVEVIRYRVTA